MNVLELADATGLVTGVAKKDCREVVSAVFDVVLETLKRGEEVRLGSVGRLTVLVRGPRTARNPHTGEKIDVPERRVVSFKQFAGMKEHLNPKPRERRRVVA